MNAKNGWLDPDPSPAAYEAWQAARIEELEAELEKYRATDPSIPAKD